MAPFRFCRSATQSEALSAARHFSPRASASAASPVLLVLGDFVVVPPPKLPLRSWVRTSQASAAATDRFTFRDGRSIDCRLVTAIAVASVSGARSLDAAPSQVWSVADASAK